jgi:lisH domain-containing protein FOPNL
MSNESLKSAMRDVLESTGQLDSIKAQLRAVVFQALEASSPETRPRPPIPPVNMFINELIREYFAFNGYEHTLGVMNAELGLPQANVPRNVLASELNLAESPKSIPVLYALVNEARASRLSASMSGE